MPTERKTIAIESVEEPREVGTKGAKLTEFLGEDNVVYECWKTSLLEHIKQGNKIDADVEHTVYTTDQGTQYPHNKITQIYVGGEAVNKPKQWTPGGRDSPETRSSIESQKRSDIIKDLWIAGKIKDDDPLVAQMRKWLSKGEGVINIFQPNEPPTKVTTAEKIPVKETLRQPELKPVMANASLRARIFKAADQWNLTTEERNENVGLLLGERYGVDETSQLTKAQAEELIKYIQDGENQNEI